MMTNSRPSGELELQGITVAVGDVRGAAQRFASALGLDIPDVDIDDSPGVEAKMARFHIGGQRYVLMEDSSGSGPVARFINRKGEGVFSVLLAVPEIDVAMADFRDAGAEFVESEPRDAVHDDGSKVRIAWVHPRSFNGVLIELQQVVEP
jgi:methylmalonyl-CoA/ethylmalonyl-CoA epimerase